MPLSVWSAVLRVIETTPTPTPTGDTVYPDANSVTPGVVGFVITGLVMVVTILLILDMVRRMRRVRYRAEAQQEIRRELRDQEAAADAEPPTGAAPTDAEPTDPAPTDR